MVCYIRRSSSRPWNYGYKSMHSSNCTVHFGCPDWYLSGRRRCPHSVPLFLLDEKETGKKREWTTEKKLETSLFQVYCCVKPQFLLLFCTFQPRSLSFLWAFVSFLLDRLFQIFCNLFRPFPLGPPIRNDTLRYCGKSRGPENLKVLCSRGMGQLFLTSLLEAKNIARALFS